MPKILIVDDEKSLRELVKESLEKLEDKGVELIVAANGEEAIEFVKAEKPELIILDVMLPGMNGFEVCNIVKNKLGMKDTYVLILTASMVGINKENYEDVGADILMTKPFDPDEIIKVAAKILEIEI
jgi:two-component system alkaline phosphatase synthesis response regulator PhoP